MVILLSNILKDILNKQFTWPKIMITLLKEQRNVGCMSCNQNISCSC